MARLVVTGASGYIGQRLCALARAEGHDIVVLGRVAPPDSTSFLPWNLGERTPQAAFSGADSVIHLAHSWADDARGGDLNEKAAEELARAALAQGVKRFVFASTNSARPGARNVYGRVKYAAEKKLRALAAPPGRVVSVRIGLVYGGRPSGQYAMMRKLTAMTPVLPMLGLDRQVQPIYLDEVCKGLLATALNSDLTEPCYVLAGKPVTFAAWLKMLRKAQTGLPLLLLPIPLGPVLLACDVFTFLPKERILGLAAAEPMDSDASLKALGIRAADPLTQLCREEAEISGGEPGALLRYLGHEPGRAMQKDLVLGLERQGLSPLGLPRLFLKHPALIALIEPPANRHRHRLAQALYLASQVGEAHQPGKKRPAIALACLLAAGDLLLLPLRLFTARRFR